jgi:hypothetical protein
MTAGGKPGWEALRQRVIAAAQAEFTPLTAVLAALEFVAGERVLTRAQALNVLCVLHEEEGLFELHACDPGVRRAPSDCLRGAEGLWFDRLTLCAVFRRRSDGGGTP